MIVRCWLVLVALVTGAPAARSADSDRPNFLFIMSDDQGWGDTGYQGHPVLKTPELDAMAANGVRLDRFYAGSPVCSPTRASCLTGRHAYRTGVWLARHRQNFRNEEVTLAEVLQPRGYATGFFGKWHFKSPIDDDDPEAEVFDERIQEVAQPWQPPRHEDNTVTPWGNGFDESFACFGVVPTFDPLYTPDYPDKRYIGPRGVGSLYGKPYFEKLPGRPYEVIREGLRGPNPKVIVDRTVPFLRRAAREDKPFLCYVWFHTPHRPVVAGDAHRALYPELSEDEQHWFGSISAMDEQIGRLRAELRELGVADNTMVWFCSDNGPAGCDGIRCYGSTGGLRGGKGSLWEGGVRVPGLLEWPAKVSAGGVCEAPISTSDYLPTVLALLGIDDAKLVEPIDGKNVWPLLSGEQSTRKDPICFRSRDEYAVMLGRWKLYGRDGKRPKLFDLSADASESNNLAGEHTAKLGELLSIHKHFEASWRRSLARLDYK